MTTLIGCPEPVLLSQLLDRELAQEEENVLRRHVETCIECNARLDQLAKAKNMAQSGLRHALQSLFVTPSLECFSPECVSAYVQRQLSGGHRLGVGPPLKLVVRQAFEKLAGRLGFLFEFRQ